MKNIREKVNSNTYSDEVRLLLQAAEDRIQVKRFYDILKVFGNLNIVSYNWSEKEGLSITVSLKEPTALEDVLMLIPMIEKVYKKKKDIIVVLNCYSPDTTFPVLTNYNEGTLVI